MEPKSDFHTPGLKQKITMLDWIAEIIKKVAEILKKVYYFMVSTEFMLIMQRLFKYNGTTYRLRRDVCTALAGRES